MHTEHLNNLRPGLVFTAWFIAVAVTSLLIFVMIWAGLLDPEDSGGTRLIMLAVAIGFFAGGFLAGLIGALAPILYGIAIGLTSLVIWVVVNGLVTTLFPDFAWQHVSAEVSVSMILVQIIGAVLGARFGYRRAVVSPVVPGGA